MSESVDQLHAQLQASLADTFLIERELGGGGMSRVFLAEETRFRRRVVIKVLAPELAEGLSNERFEREIALAASLQHANVVPVLTAGDVHGLPWYVMPYVEGESLRARLDRGPLAPDEATRILADVARALGYAHSHGVIHRDIKPENVLLSGGAAVVADFGIAKAVSASKTHAPGGTLTVVGTSIGTPAYMAPEQAAGEDVDHRADIYAWGVLAYELLAGRHPFADRSTARALIAAHIAESAPVLRGAPLVMRCLEKDPTNRPQSADEMLAVTQIGPVGSRFPTRGIAVVAVLLAVSLSAFAWRRRAAASDTPLAPSATPPSQLLAVLPFANVGGDSAQQYFADGLADELTTALSHVPGLQVASRSAAFAPALRVLDASAAGRRLGVGTVLEGAVRHAGSRIRLSAQLVSVRDGLVLWSEEFEHEGADVFAAQDDLTHRVAKALHDRLAVTRGAEAVLDRGTHDEAAYDLYLRARFLFTRRGSTEMHQAVQLLDQAIARDSTFARALATQAMVHVVLPEYTLAGEERWAAMFTTKGLQYAARAIALDSTIADAWLAQGYGLIARWDWARSDSSFRRALALDPGSADAHHWYADLLFIREDLAGSLAEMRRALQLDPGSAIIASEISVFLYQQRQYEQSIAAGRRAVEIDSMRAFTYFNQTQPFLLLGQPDSALALLAKSDGLSRETRMPIGRAVRVAAFVKLGRQNEARRELAQLEQDAVRGQVNFYSAALARAAVGDVDGSIRWLTRSVEARESLLSNFGMPCEPMLDPIRDDARFDALVGRMGLGRCAVPTERR